MQEQKIQEGLDNIEEFKKIKTASHLSNTEKIRYIQRKLKTYLTIEQLSSIGINEKNVSKLVDLGKLEVFEEKGRNSGNYFYSLPEFNTSGV